MNLKCSILEIGSIFAVFKNRIFENLTKFQDSNTKLSLLKRDFAVIK